MLPFTPRLRVALAFAESRAEVPDGLDLLHGIASLGSGVAVKILTVHGLIQHTEPNENFIQPLPDDGRPISYGDDALLALAGAISEAVRLEHELVGVEHLLVGILTVPSEKVIEYLTEKKVSLDALLQELRSEM